MIEEKQGQEDNPRERNRGREREDEMAIWD
jgi:hypothetical protein